MKQILSKGATTSALPPASDPVNGSLRLYGSRQIKVATMCSRQGMQADFFSNRTGKMKRRVYVRIDP